MGKKFWFIVVPVLLAVIGVGALLGSQALAQNPPPTSTPTSTPKKKLSDEFISKLAAKLGVDAAKLRQAIMDTRQELRQEHPNLGRGARGPRLAALGQVVKTTADLTGLTPQQVLDALKQGKTLAQIAQDHGKTPAQLKQAITDQATAFLNQQVSQGRITTQQRDNMLSQLSSMLDNLINNPLPKPGPMGHMGPGFFGAGGHHQKSAPAPTATP